MWQRILLISSFLAASPALAQTSIYTKLNLKETCVIISEYELGGTFLCQGYLGYPIIFSEGDLRQMVQFGHVPNLNSHWESFGEFNNANETVEWRVKDKKPYAAILRRFIENPGEDGAYAPDIQGEVLVVSTVGTHEKPGSCVVGYIDARANKNANEMARELADTKASSFTCGVDKPEFSGNVGPHSGSPTRSFQ